MERRLRGRGRGNGRLETRHLSLMRNEVIGRRRSDFANRFHCSETSFLESIGTFDEIFSRLYVARSMLFLILVLIRTTGVLLILLSTMGWDSTAAALILVFWGIPVLFVVFTLGFVERFSDRYGTYVTSIGSVIPLVLFSGGNNGDPKFFSTFAWAAIWWSALWIASGLLLKWAMPTRKPGAPSDPLVRRQPAQREIDDDQRAIEHNADRAGQ
jgi:hypothetical protein